jgi:alkylresorcinol/alkylpyrone synthase
LKITQPGVCCHKETPMPRIRSLATAVPPHAVPQELVRAAAGQHFATSFPQIERYLPVFDNARIATRHFAVPLEWFGEPHSFQECNDVFVAVAADLGEHAARACLADAGLTPGDIDHLFWVSTTGLAAPSPDALLINRLGMGRHTRRTPIWGLGCAGGIAGLARASEYVRAFPEQRALLLSVELCSVTFQYDDRSRRNLIAASLFADGAAAVLLEGDRASHAAQPRRPAPRVLDTMSTIWPDSIDIMGWDIVDSGMRVVFSPRIPGIIAAEMRPTVEELLARSGLGLADVDHWVLHPGGAKVIRAYEAALAIDPERLQPTRDVLREYGNMSSCTVFFVLERFLGCQRPAPGEYALLAVLGPGFSCELALVQG